MVFLTRLTALTAAVNLWYALPVSADSWDVAAKARAGVEQQSNVNISELQQASGRADLARLLEAELTADWQASSAWRLSGGYSVQDKHYQRSDDYDSRLHLTFVDAGYQLGQTTVGSNLYYAQARVANARLLTLHQASVYAMHPLNESWFLRPAFTLSEKNFASLHQRDASSRKLNADSFWFFHHGQRFVSVGMHYEQERSEDPAFRFRGPGVKITVSNQFVLWQLKQQVQLTATFSQRHYAHQQEPSRSAGADAVTDHLNTNNSQPDPNTRRDQHSQLAARWQLKIHPKLAVLTALEHGDFSSSLDTADYRETRSSIALQLSF